MNENSQNNSISPIIDYPLDSSGNLITRRGDITKLKPRLEAPHPDQMASVDWTMRELFGNREDAIQMIESLVAGQGENADEKWIRFILLFRQWEIQYIKGELKSPPNLNQVCYSLKFDSSIFISQLQKEISNFMGAVAKIKTSLSTPKVIDNVINRATSEDADTKDIELHLKIAGVIVEKSGVNINMTQQNAVLLKGEKDKLKSPLLQFSETVESIDDEVRDSR